MAEILDVITKDDGQMQGARKRAGYGNVKQSFENVACMVNQNPHMSQKVNWKAVQDSYKRLKDDLQRTIEEMETSQETRHVKWGSYISPYFKCEKRETFLSQQRADKVEKKRREEEKELMGRGVVELALCRKSKRGTVEDVDEASISGVSSRGENDGGNSATEKRNHCMAERLEVSGELSLFGEKFKEADMARVQLEVDQLAIQKEKYAKELEER